MDDGIRRSESHQTGETSAANLLRECGLKLTDRALWTRFQQHFQSFIRLYLMRALRQKKIQDDVADIVLDLVQKVHQRLVQYDGRILREFRGSTDFSVMAFLSRVSTSVVHDHLTHLRGDKRRVQLGPIDVIESDESPEERSPGFSAFDSNAPASILSWIDIERIIDGDPDHKNAGRNIIIFKLHCIDGFEAGEIANFPGFELTKSGVDAVLARLRKRIPEGTGI